MSYYAINALRGVQQMKTKTRDEMKKIWEAAVAESKAHCDFCKEHEDGESLWYLVYVHDGDIEGLPRLCESWAALEVEG